MLSPLPGSARARRPPNLCRWAHRLCRRAWDVLRMWSPARDWPLSFSCCMQPFAPRTRPSDRRPRIAGQPNSSVAPRFGAAYRRPTFRFRPTSHVARMDASHYPGAWTQGPRDKWFGGTTSACSTKTHRAHTLRTRLLSGSHTKSSVPGEKTLAEDAALPMISLTPRYRTPAPPEPGTSARYLTIPSR